VKKPKFKNEKEEADYWYRNRRQVEADLRQVRKSGASLTVAEIAAREQTRPVSIRLAVRDIERARQLATAKGIGYQTLLRMLIHTSLENPNGV
jgi:predicted DNA binding CopG/RHH family protein